MNSENGNIIIDDLGEPEWRAGEIITCLVGSATANFGLPFGGAQVYGRGQKIRVTRDTLLHQSAMLDLVADTDAQIRRWGQQRFARGEVQIDPWSEVGDRVWIETRARAREVAHHIVDPTERAAALQAIEKRFGSVPTSVSTEIPAGPQQRALADDAARRAAQPTHHVKSLSY